MRGSCFYDRSHIRRIIMALSAGDKAKIIEEYRLEEGDTGSPEVQVALLTNNINV